VRLGSWRVPPLFRLLAERGAVSAQEMRRVFNMGIGMVLLVAEEASDEILDHLRRHGEEPVALGEVAAGGAGVEYVTVP
jgi:phosphoribosylformylglycinamidine cyclo-ligase